MGWVIPFVMFAQKWVRTESRPRAIAAGLVVFGVGDPHTTPLREGWITGLATAIGALIPVSPFLVLDGSYNFV